MTVTGCFVIIEEWVVGRGVAVGSVQTSCGPVMKWLKIIIIIKTTKQPLTDSTTTRCHVVVASGGSVVVATTTRGVCFLGEGSFFGVLVHEDAVDAPIRLYACVLIVVIQSFVIIFVV